MTNATAPQNRLAADIDDVPWEDVEPTQADGVQAEINVFATSPSGFSVHVKLSHQEAAHVLRNLNLLLGGLARDGYTAGRGGATKAGESLPFVDNKGPAIDPSAPLCQTCGGFMELKSGTSKKNNKPWKAWMCIDGKDDPARKHEAIFF